MSEPVAAQDGLELLEAASREAGVERWRSPLGIPATLGLVRGRRYRIRQGIRGLLVPDECGFAVAYMICEPSSHYYRVMTGSDRMPVLIEERL